MEVTVDNWRESVPLLEAALREADLVAMDTELTGLCRFDWAHTSWAADSLEMRYAKARDAARSLGVTQYGLCALRFARDRGVWEAR